MRIARVISRLNLGGPARQILASDPVLTERGHAVRIFTGTPTPGEGDLFEEARARGLDVVRIPGLARGLAPVGDLRAARALRRALAEHAPDVLHTHASKAGLLGRRAARGMEGLARVHTFHGHVLEGYFPEPVSRALVALERRLARETDRVLAVSHATADDLVRLGVVPEERLMVVPPGADLAPLLAIERPDPHAGVGAERAGAARAARAPGVLRELVGAGPGDFLLGFVARLAEVKRPGMAVEVVELLAGRYPALHLVLVGDGPERGALERRIASLPGGLADRVHLVGARTDVPAVLADLDAVLLTSRTEGLPVALVEAGAAGLPVVGTDVGGVGELVAHERTGYLGHGVDELAWGVSRLLDDETERRAMGRRARMRVAARHGAEVLADRLEELYRVVVEERRCAS